LIREVFKNSNFTNNVKSGNLQEVLALIGEIDQDRLLKTDLLGDATKARTKLGWQPTTTFEELVKMTARADDELIGRRGF